MTDARGARSITDWTRDWTLGVLAIAFIAFSGLDCVTTGCALATGYREENPVTASIYAQHGMASVYLTRAAVVAAVLIGLRFLPRRLALGLGMVLTVGTALAVVSNLLTITR